MRFTSHHRWRSWVAAFLLVAGWGVPLSLPHVSNDDLLCLVGGLAGDARARLESSSTETPADHCVICHATRTFRTSVVDGKPVAIDLLPGTLLSVRSDAFHVGTRLGRLPARAPPLA